MKRRFLPIFLSVAMIVGSVDMPAGYVYAEAAVQSDYRTEAVSGSDISADDAAENISAENVSAGDVSESDAAWDDVSANDVSASDVSEQDASTNDVSEQDVSVSDVSLGDPAVATAEEHVKATDISAYLTVDANGTITKYDPGTATVTDILIPSSVGGITVTAIGKEVFKGHTEIASVEFPSTLKEIKDGAFHGAGLGTPTKSGSLTIPASVDTIGQYAFLDTLYLGSITFEDAEYAEGETPQAITFIDPYGYGADTFKNGAKLTSIKLSNRVITVPNGFAEACTRLTTVEWSTTLSTIGNSAFEGDTALTSSDFSQTRLSTIGDTAFKNCSALEEIKFPQTLVSIGHSAFCKAGLGQKTKSGSLTIPASVDTIGQYAFAETLYLGSVTFEDAEYAEGETPQAIQFVDPYGYGNYTFQNSAKLTSIRLSNRMVTVPNRFAETCTLLTTVEWPTTLDTIGHNAFEGDTALTSSDFSQTRLSTVGDTAFKNCSALEEVKFPQTLVSIGNNAFCKAGLGQKTKSGSLTIPASVDTIGQYAFAETLYLGTVTFEDAEYAEGETPQAITFIDPYGYGNYTFQNSAKLTSIRLSNRMVTVPNRFAEMCTLLTTVEWPTTLDTIGHNAFEGDTALTSSDFSQTRLSTVGDTAFKNCSALEEVKFPQTLVSIGNNAFCKAGLGQKTKSGSLTIPASVDTIGQYAFAETLYLGTVTFEDAEYAAGETPQAITFIDPYGYGNYTFQNSAKLTSIRLSNRMVNIPNVFASGCALLTTVEWPTTLDTIGHNAFEGDTALTSSDFSQTRLSTVGDSAFKNCSALEEVKFPQTLVSIGNNAFCKAGLGQKTKSGSLTIPASVDTIGQYAFAESLYLEAVVFEDAVYAADETPVWVQFADPYGYGTYTFQNSAKLTSIRLSNRVTQIPNQLAAYCAALQYITIAGDVKTIGNKAFYVDKTGTKKDQLVETVLTTNSTIAKEYDWASDNRKLVDKIAGSKPPVEEEQPTIIEIVNPTSVKLSGVTALTVGAKSKLNVTIEPTDNANLDRRLVWESSDASIVTVDTTGTVTALKAGTASVTVTAAADASVKDSISITVTAEDDVEAQDMAERPENVEEGGIWAVLYEENGKVINADKKFTYTGAAIKPVVHVYNGNKRLYEGTDYTLSYVKNSAAVSAGDNAGKAVDAKSWDKKTPAVVINPKGNLKDKVYILFSIEKKSLADTDVTARDLTLKYNNGKALKVKSVVQYNGKALKENKDYKITGVTKGDATVDIKQIGTEAGTYTVAIAGTEVNFTGTTTFDVNVAENAAASAFLSLKKSTVTYSEGGAALAKFPNQSYLGTDVPVELDAEKLIVQAKDAEQKDVTLKAGTDYLISYQNNRKPGTAKLILTGIGAYAGSSVTKTFKIDKLTMSDAAVSAGTMSIEGMDAAFTFVKGGVKPQPKVTWKFANGSTETLVLGKDYTLAYAKNALCGSAATLTIKGKGNFAGSVTKGFSIQAQTDGTVIDVQAADVVYKEKKGNWQTKVTLLDADGKKLVAGKDYDKNLSYVVVSVPAGSSIRIGQVPGASTVLPVGTVVKVSAKGIDNYDGAVFTGSYRVTPASISGVTFKIADQDYTGAPIYPTKSQIQITKAPKGMSTSDVTYEIVSYGVNTSKGNGTVVVRGTGNFGGYKTIKFKIGPRSIFDWWRK